MSVCVVVRHTSVVVQNIEEETSVVCESDSSCVKDVLLCCWKDRKKAALHVSTVSSGSRSVCDIPRTAINE